MFVTLERAMEVTLALAYQGVLDEKRPENDELAEVRDEQLASIQTVEDFFTNYWIKEDK